MSVRDYGVNDYGLLLTEETMKILASKICEDYTNEEYEAFKYEFNDVVVDHLCDYISNFDGEAIRIRDDGSDDWYANNSSEFFSDDTIYFIPLMNYPVLFKPAYASMDEVVAEMKDKVGEYLPDGFDYRNYIRHIVGTYYG